MQAEAVFEDRVPPVTTDKGKCNLVLRALPCHVLEKVEHVLSGPEPIGGRYPALQAALIECYGRSQSTKYAQLIELTRPGSLGDRNPMEFLLHMRSLSGGDNEAWERAIFLNAMPPEVRTVLANSNAPNNKRLATEARRVLEQHRRNKSQATAYEVRVRPASDEDGASGIEPADYSGGRRRQEPREVNATDYSGGRRREPQGLQPRQGNRADTKLCIPHYRFGAQAFTCHGGQCPMRDTPLARRPRARGPRAQGCLLYTSPSPRD